MLSLVTTLLHTLGEVDSSNTHCLAFTAVTTCQNQWKCANNFLWVSDMPHPGLWSDHCWDCWASVRV